MDIEICRKSCNLLDFSLHSFGCFSDRIKFSKSYTFAYMRK